MPAKFPDRPAWPLRARRLCGMGILLGVIAGLMLSVALEQAHAAPLRRLGQHPRALAMGNTGISYSNDEMALFYNPAGLGTVEDSWTEITPIAIEASEAASDLLSSAGGNLTTADLQNLVGEEIRLRAFFYPHVLLNFNPGFTIGIAYFLESQQEITVLDLAGNANGFFREDRGTAFGLSFPTFDGAVLWGISARNIERTTGEQFFTLPPTGEVDLELLLNAQTGKGTAFDLGLIWRIESFPSLRGQFGLVVQNVGETDLGLAGTIPQEVSFGWSFRPEITKLVPLMFAIEFRDATKELTTDDSTAKRTHLGVEIGFIPQDASTNLVTLRAGLNGSSPSYGVEFSLWHSFTIQYVIFFEEVGFNSGQDSRKRQLLQFNLLGF